MAWALSGWQVFLSSFSTSPPVIRQGSRDTRISEEERWEMFQANTRQDLLFFYTYILSRQYSPGWVVFHMRE